MYKDNQERLLNHYVKGEDPDDPEILLNDLREIFAQTKNMIKNVAKKQGIEIDERTEEEVTDVAPEEYIIYRLAQTYFRGARSFIKQLERAGIPETVRESFDDLVWYHTLIAAKTGRLVSGFIDDFVDAEVREVEEEGTLKVIYKSIDLSKDALQEMLNELPDQLNAIAELMGLLKRLGIQIETDSRKKVDK